jgi:hypothetical protein
MKMIRAGGPGDYQQAEACKAGWDLLAEIGANLEKADQ